MKNRFWNILISSAIFAITFACSSNTLTSPKDVVFPSSSVSYSKHVKPFLNLACAYQGCHSKESAQGGIALVDYADLTSGASSLGLIVDYKPASSRLYQVISGSGSSVCYQYFKNDINDNNIKGIYQWILEGAKLN